jgi:hypothetical protein
MIRCSDCGRFLHIGLFTKTELPQYLGGSYKGLDARRCITCVAAFEDYRENYTRRSSAGRRAARKLVRETLGTLPKHWFVVFKNGDNRDVRLENLFVVTGPNAAIVKSIVSKRQWGLYGKIDMALYHEQKEAVLA